MAKDKTKNQLFNSTPQEYGGNYHAHFFEQYKMFVEGAEKISDRRQNANNYFITINAALVSFLGLSFQVKFLEDLGWVKALIAILGLVICIIFWFLLRSYKQLNSGKFKVIHKIEETLPLALYDYEWKILSEGKNKKLYYPFSHIELLVPWTFGFIYVILGIIFLC